MSEDFIQLPKVENVKKLLTQAKADIDTAIGEESELATQGTFVKQVIGLVDEKIAKHNDLNKLNFKEKIDVASHLVFLQNVIEDFFNMGLDDDEDGEDFDLDMEEDEEGMKPNDMPKSGLPMKKDQGHGHGGGCCGGGHHHH